MQLRKLLLPRLLSVTLLSGYSLFSGEEDVVRMSPLPVAESQFTPFTEQSTSVGDGIGDFYSSLHPTLVDNVVYATDRAGITKALNAGNGKEVWSVNLGERDSWFSRASAQLSGGVTVSGGHVYIGSEKAQVYALNTSDGTAAWQTKAAGEALSRPVVSDGVVLIHTSNGQLQALSGADGAIEWTVNLDTPSLSLCGKSAPTTTFGTAIVSSDNGRMSAVLTQQGQMIWQQRILQATGPTEIGRLSDVDTTPVIVNGVVYALVCNGDLTALDLRSGQIMQKRELGSMSDFIVDGNRIYLVDQNDRVLALTTDGGVTLWMQNDLLHRLLASPILYNGNLVVGDSEDYLYRINVDDGRFVAQQKVDSLDFLTEPVSADGKLLIQAKDGTLYSITR